MHKTINSYFKNMQSQKTIKFYLRQRRLRILLAMVKPIK